MSKNIVHNGQSFLDKVIEITGDVENVFAMALLNGINVSDYLLVGTELIPSDVTKRVVADFFTIENKPATALSLIDEQNEFDNYEFPQGEFPISL